MECILHTLILMVLTFIIPLTSVKINASEYIGIDRKQGTENWNDQIIAPEQLQPSFSDLPYNDNLLAHKALEYKLQNDYEGAIKVYEEALIDNPNDVWLLNSIAEIYCNSIGNFEKAYLYYEAAYNVDPNSPIAIVGYAFIQAIYGNNKYAEELLCPFLKNTEIYAPIYQLWILRGWGVYIEVEFIRENEEELLYALDAILKFDMFEEAYVDVLHAYNVVSIFYTNKEIMTRLNYIWKNIISVYLDRNMIWLL